MTIALVFAAYTAACIALGVIADRVITAEPDKPEAER
jgi:hypothetical protein